MTSCSRVPKRETSSGPCDFLPLSWGKHVSSCKGKIKAYRHILFTSSSCQQQFAPLYPRCHGSYVSQQDVTSLPTALHPKPRTCRGSESQPQGLRSEHDGGVFVKGGLGLNAAQTQYRTSAYCVRQKKHQKGKVSVSQ